MAQIVVRNIDDDIMRGLKTLAAREGISAEQAVRTLIENAVAIDRGLASFREAAVAARAGLLEEYGTFGDSTRSIRRDRGR